MADHAKLSLTDQSRGRRLPAFFKCGIPVGAEVVLEAKPDVVATVKDERQIEYNGKPYSLSALAQEVLQTPYPLQGPVFWTYQGKKLRDIRLEREKQGLYQGLVLFRINAHRRLVISHRPSFDMDSQSALYCS